MANLCTFGMEICLLRKYKLEDSVNQQAGSFEGELDSLGCLGALSRERELIWAVTKQDSESTLIVNCQVEGGREIHTEQKCCFTFA
jgi:hypothetical protein